jgi:hypothetical protein
VVLSRSFFTFTLEWSPEPRKRGSVNPSNGPFIYGWSVPYRTDELEGYVMTDHRSKMAPTKDAPPGLETDGKGNVIPFEKRTKDDQEKVMGNIAANIRETSPEDAHGRPSDQSST